MTSGCPSVNPCGCGSNGFFIILILFILLAIIFGFTSTYGW